MQEDRAARARHDGRVVETEHDDKIVEMILAPQCFCAGAIGQFDRPVVGRIERRVAPAVIARDAAQRQARLRRAQSGRRDKARRRSGKMPTGVTPSPSDALVADSASADRRTTRTAPQSSTSFDAIVRPNDEFHRREINANVDSVQRSRGSRACRDVDRAAIGGGRAEGQVLIDALAGERRQQARP